MKPTRWFSQFRPRGDDIYVSFLKFSEVRVFALYGYSRRSLAVRGIRARSADDLERNLRRYAQLNLEEVNLRGFLHVYQWCYQWAFHCTDVEIPTFLTFPLGMCWSKLDGLPSRTRRCNARVHWPLTGKLAALQGHALVQWIVFCAFLYRAVALAE